MKYVLEYRTPYHSFRREPATATEEELVKEFLKFREHAAKIDWLSMETEEGYVILPSELARQTAIVLHRIKEATDGELGNDQASG